MLGLAAATPASPLVRRLKRPMMYSTMDGKRKECQGCEQENVKMRSEAELYTESFWWTKISVRGWMQKTGKLVTGLWKHVSGASNCLYNHGGSEGIRCCNRERCRMITYTEYLKRNNVVWMRKKEMREGLRVNVVLSEPLPCLWEAVPSFGKGNLASRKEYLTMTPMAQSSLAYCKSVLSYGS